jgi:hypothetical protein
VSVTNAPPAALTLLLVTAMVSTVESSEYVLMVMLPEEPLTTLWSNCTIRVWFSDTPAALSLGLVKTRYDWCNRISRANC